MASNRNSLGLGEDYKWREVILNNLILRNYRETLPFKDIIPDHERIFENLETSTGKTVSLTVQNERLRQENSELTIKAHTGSNNGPASEKIQNLEKKLYKLQEELTGMHRRKGENAQQLIDLNNVLSSRDKVLVQKTTLIEDVENSLLSMKTNERVKDQRLSELRQANQALVDEHQTLHLMHVNAELELKRVKQENQELIKRWMDQKSKDADMVNAENDNWRARQTEKMKTDLAEASKQVSNLGEFVADCYAPQSMATIPSQAICKVDAHDGEIFAVRFANQSNYFTTGGADRKVKLWKVEADQCVSFGTLVGCNNAITCLDMDVNDQYVLASCNDHASRIWSVTDHRLKKTLTGHSAKVHSAKYLGDNNKVISGSNDRTLKVWDLRSTACFRTIFAGSSCNDVVACDSGGNTIISGHFDKKIRFWDIRSETATNELTLQNKITSLDLTRNRLSLLSSSRDDCIKIIDMRMDQVRLTLVASGFKLGTDWSRASFSPDGLLVSCGSNDGSLFIWDVLTGKLERQHKEHNSCITACGWQIANRYIATVDRHKKLVLWS